MFLMRVLLGSTAVAILLGFGPAFAMCGAPAASKQMSEWPAAPHAQAQQQQSSMGMCPCCKNMASMGGMKADDPHKGMDMQKQ
jgi:hypothetical protein